MNASLATVAYIGATILFILSLGGLSNQETARRGNLYGMIGMSLAVLATVFGPQVTAEGIPMIVGAMLVGAAAVARLPRETSGQPMNDEVGEGEGGAGGGGGNSEEEEGLLETTR